MNGQVVGVTAPAGQSYQFSAVHADGSISATFAVNTFVITPSAGSGGSISPSTPQTVDYGAVSSFTVTAAVGNHILDVKVDGVSVLGSLVNGVYTFLVVSANHAIDATFAVNSYTITVSAGVNGQISPGTGSVSDGATPIYTVTPDVGYHIASITVNGQVVGVTAPAGQSYQFSAVHADGSISATFAVNTFVITPSAGSGGSISPSTPQTVDYGAVSSFTVTAAVGNHILDVKVDGVSVLGSLVNGVYTFLVVSANHAIDATFAVNSYTITVSAGVNGQISPGTGSVSYGATPIYTLLLDVGYHIASITVNGQWWVLLLLLGKATSLVLFMLMDQSARRLRLMFVITPSAGSGGSISPGTASDG